MMQYNVKKLDEGEIAELFISGVELRCPSPGCNALLDSLPKELPKGTMPMVIKCSVTQEHYCIIFEPKDAMLKMREAMKKISKTSKK